MERRPIYSNHDLFACIKLVNLVSNINNCHYYNMHVYEHTTIQKCLLVFWRVMSVNVVCLVDLRRKGKEYDPFPLLCHCLCHLGNPYSSCGWQLNVTGTRFCPITHALSSYYHPPQDTLTRLCSECWHSLIHLLFTASLGSWYCHRSPDFYKGEMKDRMAKSYFFPPQGSLFGKWKRWVQFEASHLGLWIHYTHYGL